MQSANTLSVAVLHPAIRILLLLFLCIASASADHAQLLFTFLLLSIGFAFGQKSLLIKTLKLFYRLKWLFTSILLVYVFLGPGSEAHWSGLQAGLLRVASLMLLIAAVNLLVQSASANEFLGGLMWVLSPLKRLGLPTQRIAVRMALTLEMIPQLQSLFEDTKTARSSQKIRKDPRHYVAALASIAAEKVALTLQHAQQTAVSEIEISSLASPSPIQTWLLLGLIAMYLGLGMI